MIQRIAVLKLVVLLTTWAAHPAGGKVLEVGPTQPLRLPSQAAAIAMPADIVRIAPGEYTDCAIWRASDLLIEATGRGAVLAGRTCEGKAIFVIAGNDVTVRNLTFVGAVVPDHNGAGIRAEGRNLTIEHSRFTNNENGVLAAPTPGSTIRIVDSEFRGNGECLRFCAHGIYVDAIDRLEINHSRFLEQHIGHHIKSRARSTVLIDNDIADGPDGNSSYLVDIPNGGDLLLQGNHLEKGLHSANTGVAVAIGFEGVLNPTHELIVRDNTFISELPTLTTFVSNRTATPATVSGNHLQGHVIPLRGAGSVSP